MPHKGFIFYVARYKYAVLQEHDLIPAPDGGIL
jgi:hypothetical protein